MKRLLLIILFLLPTAVTAIDEADILDYGDAFVLSARALDEQSVEVRWDIKPNHYMYTRFLEVASDTPGVVPGEMIVPPGEEKFDELLGERVVTFHDHLIVTVPLLERPAGAGSIVLKMRSQGCLENVLCYPPTFQAVSVALPPLQAQSAGGLLDSLAAPPTGGALTGLNQDQALAPEHAFVAEAIALNAGTILVRFTAAPGYYLYKDKFSFSLAMPGGVSVRSVELPPGTMKDDPEFGNVEVYFGQVEIPVRLNRVAGEEQTVWLSANFQGCRDGDICYPPGLRDIELLLPEAAAAIGDERSNADAPGQASAAPLTEQDKLARLLLSNPGRAMLAFFGLGILLAFTPCVFPMVPILSGIIAGQGDNVSTRKAFVLSLVYVLAMALTYTVVGVIAGMFGKNLQAIFQNPWIISGFSGLFVLLSLSMFGFYELQLPASVQSRLASISGKQEGGNLLGVGIMGFLSALIVGPCVAPPLAAALIVIGGSGDAVLGGGALFSMAMGMGIPLIVVGTSAGRLLPRAGAWMNAIKAVFGVGLLALAIWMLERILDGWIIMMMWGVLAIGSAIFMGALDRLQPPVSGWQRLWKTLGLVLLLLGAAEIGGALSGGDDWQRPLSHLRTGGGEIEHVEFQRIKSVDDLDAALARAAATGRTAMLDFYADWCVECKRMEKTTFRDPLVVQALAGTILLQADVTAFDAVDEALVKRFSLYGPPALLFFDKAGNERPHVRMIGYMNAEEFMDHLALALEGQ